MSDENWAETIPDDLACDRCGHEYGMHNESGCVHEQARRFDCDCDEFRMPYPPDTSNAPTSREEMEQP